MKKFKVYWTVPTGYKEEIIEADGFEVADGVLVFYKTLSGEEYDGIAVCHEVNVCAFNNWSSVEEVESCQDV